MVQELRGLEVERETLLFQVDVLQDTLEGVEELLAEAHREAGEASSVRSITLKRCLASKQLKQKYIWLHPIPSYLMRRLFCVPCIGSKSVFPLFLGVGTRKGGQEETGEHGQLSDARGGETERGNGTINVANFTVAQGF